MQVAIYLWWTQFNFNVQLRVLRFICIGIAVLSGFAFMMDLPRVKWKNVALLSEDRNLVGILKVK